MGERMTADLVTCSNCGAQIGPKQVHACPDYIVVEDGPPVYEGDGLRTGCSCGDKRPHAHEGGKRKDVGDRRKSPRRYGKKYRGRAAPTKDEEGGT